MLRNSFICLHVFDIPLIVNSRSYTRQWLTGSEVFPENKCYSNIATSWRYEEPLKGISVATTYEYTRAASTDISIRGAPRRYLPQRIFFTGCYLLHLGFLFPSFVALCSFPESAHRCGVPVSGATRGPASYLKPINSEYIFPSDCPSRSQ